MTTIEMFKILKEQFGSGVLRTARKYIKSGKCIARHRSHLYFNHECIRQKVLPTSLQIKSPINSTEGKALARKFGFQYLKLRIQNSHQHIRFGEAKCNELLVKLSTNLPHKLLDDLIEHLSAFQNKLMKANKRKHDVHVNSLISAVEPAPPQTRLPHNEIKKKWVVNLSGTKLSEAQTHVLQLGLNFAAAPTQIPTHRILAAVEKSLTKFTVGEANHVRSKVIGVIKNHRPPKSTLSSEETKALK